MTPALGPADGFRPATEPRLTRTRQTPPPHATTTPGPPLASPSAQPDPCRPAGHGPDPDPDWHQDPPTDAPTAPPQHLRPHRLTAGPHRSTPCPADLDRQRPTPDLLAATRWTLADLDRRRLPPTSARLATRAPRRPPRPATADLEPAGDLLTAARERPRRRLDRCDGRSVTLTTSPTGRVDTPDR